MAADSIRRLHLLAEGFIHCCVLQAAQVLTCATSHLQGEDGSAVAAPVYSREMHVSHRLHGISRV